MNLIPKYPNFASGLFSASFLFPSPNLLHPHPIYVTSLIYLKGLDSALYHNACSINAYH